MNNKVKRGQAALEFLMTYGWAILAAVIVVGVLWYIIGNPSNLAGNNFQISNPLVQKGVNIDTTGVSLNVLNGAAETIHVQEINVSRTGCDLYTTVIDIARGVEQDFDITCSGLNQGDSFNADVRIIYTQGTSTFNQTSTGSVSGSVA